MKGNKDKYIRTRLLCASVGASFCCRVDISKQTKILLRKEMQTIEKTLRKAVCHLITCTHAHIYVFSTFSVL